MEQCNLNSPKAQDGAGLGRLWARLPWAKVLNWLQRYSIAVVCVLGAFGVRYSLNPLIGGQSPFMVFAPAAFISAGFAGLGPGLAAMIAGLVLGDYFFTPPLHSWGPYGPAEITLMATYLITTTVGILLFHLLQRSKLQTEIAARQAEAAAQEAQRQREALTREVIERKRTEAALQAAQAKLSEYASDLEDRVAERTANLQESVRSLESVLYHVAHDLRAPLRAMYGFTTILSEQYGTRLDSAGRDYANRVSEAARRMDDLLQDLLEYGRICHIDLLCTNVALDDFVPAVLERFSGLMQTQKASLEVRHPLPTVWADPKLLETVLTELVSNALKFVAKDCSPRVRIWTETQPQRVRLFVEDNGIGIEPNHQERVFRIFERLHTNPAYSGTGIGLAIAQKAMRRMGGEVGVQSEPGKGSRFWLDLPAPSRGRMPNLAHSGALHLPV